MARDVTPKEYVAPGQDVAKTKMHRKFPFTARLLSYGKKLTALKRRSSCLELV